MLGGGYDAGGGMMLREVYDAGEGYDPGAMLERMMCAVGCWGWSDSEWSAVVYGTFRLAGRSVTATSAGSDCSVTAASAGPDCSVTAASAGPDCSVTATSAGPDCSVTAASAGPDCSVTAASADPD